jgi:diketogulonate reductase-like aldo/keto reductase
VRRWRYARCVPRRHHRSIPTLRLGDGTRVARLGLGTWHMGEARATRAREVAALQAGIDAGFTLFDTAEMYGDGGAEEVLAQAIAGRRDATFLVSKVYPHNASRKGTLAACERSLRRLATDRLDLYLLHWRGRIPLAETVDAFERLRRAGKIVRWGVSNCDESDLDELLALPDGANCAVNQVLYHLGERGIEWSLADVCRRHAITLMAYSPLGEGALLRDPKLVRIARTLDATPAQVALAWLLAQDNVIAIPQTSDSAHVIEDRAAATLALASSARAALERAFPPPTSARPLAVI